MKRVMILIVAIITACAIFIGCNNAKPNGVSLHETPQIYILQGEDSSTTMPTVTLYENGNACLSQPPISSYAIFKIGKYEIDGNKLTVKHNDSSSATFEISDGGDTLTLLSTNLGFTKVGAVYKYRSNTDYLSGLMRVDGEKLTLDTLRELAKKAPNLAASDFEKYEHFDKDPDYHIFEIEGQYVLKVILTADVDTHCTVERNSSGESFPLSINGSTGYVFDTFLGLTSIPQYETRKWLDYFGTDEMPLNGSKELTLTEFPGVTFTWTSEKVTAGEEELFRGMPVWNVYLTDLTNDGKPELCATVSLGSGIIDNRVIVFDYVTGKEYLLSDRMYYDYFLTLENGKLMVTQTNYLDGKPLVTAELRLVNGEIFRFGNTVEDKKSDTD
jgi:hypothetical protein